MTAESPGLAYRSSQLRPGTPWKNWGRTERSTPRFTSRPRNVDEVCAVIALARDRELRIKAIGSGHSFSGIAVATGILLDLSALSGLIEVDLPRGRVRLGAGTPLHRLPAILGPLGLALENMGDIDRQTLAGATSTGTHGTGARFGGLATQVVAVTLVTATGTVLRVSETENSELLPAARLGLGSLGVLVDLTLQCVPAFLLEALERPAGFDEVLDGLAERIDTADHFEFYWWPHTDGVMTKINARLAATGAEAGERHPVGPVAGWFEDRVLSNGMLSVVCSVGSIAPVLTPSINRLATRIYGNRSFTDHSHRVFVSPRTTRFREMEYALPREHIADALREIRALIDRNGWRISFPVEVRFAAADQNWLSTAEGRATGYIAVHRYIRDDPHEYFRAVEDVMTRYNGRPHWGKMHYLDASTLAGRYPHFAEFRAARDRLDPDRIFTNDYLDRVLGP